MTLKVRYHLIGLQSFCSCHTFRGTQLGPSALQNVVQSEHGDKFSYLGSKLTSHKDSLNLLKDVIFDN